jgi:hypothetical protein
MFLSFVEIELRVVVKIRESLTAQHCSHNNRIENNRRKRTGSLRVLLTQLPAIELIETIKTTRHHSRFQSGPSAAASSTKDIYK